MSNAIVITGSLRNYLTWRKFPNKEENDKFYDWLLDRCYREGKNYAREEAGLRYRSYRADAPQAAQEDLVEVFEKRLYTYSQRSAARYAILCRDLTKRLKVADQKWIQASGGKMPEDLWKAFWKGYKEVTEEEANDPMPMPQVGELWRDEVGELIVWIGENPLTVSFYRNGRAQEISYQTFFRFRHCWRIV